MVNCCEAEASFRVAGGSPRWQEAKASLKGEPETGWLAGVLGRAVIAISAVRYRGMGVVGA